MLIVGIDVKMKFVIYVMFAKTNLSKDIGQLVIVLERKGIIVFLPSKGMPSVQKSDFSYGLLLRILC